MRFMEGKIGFYLVEVVDWFHVIKYEEIFEYSGSLNE